MELPDRQETAAQAIELRIQYKRLNSFFADYAKNIHQGRTFIATDRLLAVGTDFRFKLEAPGLSAPLVLQGKVQWLVLPEEHPEGAGMGIGFVFDSPDERARVHAIVELLMTASLGRRLFDKLVNKPRDSTPTENHASAT